MTQSAFKATAFQTDLSAFQFSSTLAKAKDEPADEASQLFLRSSALVARAAPDVSGTDFRVVSNEVKGIKPFITASDPDGDAIVKYRLQDAVDAPNSGYFMLGATKMTQNQWFVVAANRLKDVIYVAGDVADSEAIRVQAFDGSLWSSVGSFIAFTRANDNPPIVSPGNFDIRVNTSAAIDDMFERRDEDNNTIKKYRFTDTNGAAQGSYLTRNGVKVSANTTISVDASNLDDIGYQAGGKAHSELITIQAYDGKFWSNPTDIRVDTLDVPIIAPEIYTFVDEFKNLDVVNLFRKIDDGPAHIEYEIFDNNQARGSGVLSSGTSLLPAGINTLTDTQLDNLTFVGGNADQRWLDEIYIRANNRLYFGDWIKIDIRTEPVNKDGLELPGPEGSLDWSDFVPGDTITYSFLELRPSYQTAEVTDANFRRLSVTNRDYIRDALLKLGSQIGVQLEEVSDSRIDPLTGQQGGLIRVGGMNDQTKTYYTLSYGPGAAEQKGDIYLNLSDMLTAVLPDGTTGLVDNPAAQPDILSPDTFVRYLFQRELGIALGLKAPSAPPIRLPAFTDDRQFTVMTFPPLPAFFFPDVWPSSYQLYDLLALQDLYGAKTDSAINTGNNTYKWGPARRFSEAIWDASGKDTINAANQNSLVTVDLRTGSYSSIGRFASQNVGIAYGTIIENAKGSKYSDTLIGNEYRNRLEGNEGNDILDGGPENDTLLGGAGGDTYIFRLAGGNDLIDEQGKGGTDALEIRMEWDAFDNILDLGFKRLGNDLLVNLFIDNDPLNGSIRIKEMGTPASRVETLRLFNTTGQVVADIDLTSIFAGATGAEQQFKFTGGSSSFGLLAAPV